MVASDIKTLLLKALATPLTPRSMWRVAGAFLAAEGGRLWAEELAVEAGERAVEGKWGGLGANAMSFGDGVVCGGGRCEEGRAGEFVMSQVAERRRAAVGLLTALVGEGRGTRLVAVIAGKDKAEEEEDDGEEEGVEDDAEEEGEGWREGRGRAAVELLGECLRRGVAASLGAGLRGIVAQVIMMT